MRVEKVEFGAICYICVTVFWSVLDVISFFLFFSNDKTNYFASGKTVRWKRINASREKDQVYVCVCVRVRARMCVCKIKYSLPE